jgi:hypothetical protein
MNGLHCGRMTTDQIDTEHRGQADVWGARQPSPRRWGMRETAAAVAVAAVIAALGGAAIYAATESNSHPFGGSHQPFGPGGGMPDGPRGQHGAIGGPGPDAVDKTSLHGEFVVPDGGGYTTVLTQTGMVTAISPMSITVRSEDGYHQTYVIPSTAGNAGAPFAVNDQVVVRATRNGQTATVTNIGKPLQVGIGGRGGPPPHRN